MNRYEKRGHSDIHFLRDVIAPVSRGCRNGRGWESLGNQVEASAQRARELFADFKEDLHVSETLEDTELRLAAWIRQLVRARDAGDAVAEHLEAISVCSGLSWLLAEHLATARGWDNHEQWVDGLIGARVFVEESTRVKVAGQMVWGRLTARRSQWGEPFEAEVEIDAAHTGLKCYTLRMGDQRALEAKVLPTGTYGTLCADSGQVIFRPFHLLPEGEYAPSSAIRPADGVWTFEFTKMGTSR